MDLDMVLTPPNDPGLPGPPGFFDAPRDFWAIKEALGMDSNSCISLIWKEAWKGRLSADSWEPVRRGLGSGFTPPAVTEDVTNTGTPAAHPLNRRRLIPKAIRDRWKAGKPLEGSWFSLIADYCEGAPETDFIEAEELARDRVRLLSDRFGLLCRPLLEREGPAFSWSGLLPAMRRMELAGELIAGRFFSGLNSLQFASPAFLTELEEAEDLVHGAEKPLYWMNAADPASPAGLELDSPALNSSLPPRSAASRLCFRGTELIAVSERGGKGLRIFAAPDDPALPEALGFLLLPRTRKVMPVNKISLQEINGAPASASLYSGILKSLGFIADRKSLLYW
jgi:ATP-dependent Lhr-like helicase